MTLTHAVMAAVTGSDSRGRAQTFNVNAVVSAAESESGGADAGQPTWDSKLGQPPWILNGQRWLLLTLLLRFTMDSLA
jgi:hypothetical protein